MVLTKEGKVRIWVRTLRFACAGVLIFAGIGLIDASQFLHRGSLVAEALGAEAIRTLPNVCGWNKFDWDEMNAPERQAWMALGWNKKRWDSTGHSADPPSSSKDWSELTPDEQSAAKQLGYVEKTWNNSACN
jgi:hypothetical protein